MSDYDTSTGWEIPTADVSLPASAAPNAWTDIEQQWLDLEPPGLFPQEQNSVRGQRRKIYADYIQALVDQMNQWWSDMNPLTCSVDALAFWEYMVGIPVSPSITADERRLLVSLRWAVGPFTRTRRRKIVEAFIGLSFGTVLSFTTTGLVFDSGGLIFHTEPVDLSTAYRIVENIPAFSYSVRILDTVYDNMNVAGLSKELEHVTTAPITFSIVRTATP